MTNHTQVREHKWVEFRLSSVKRTIIDGVEHFVADPLSEPEITYGCEVCDMGLEEARSVSCPGFNMFEENSNGS